MHASHLGGRQAQRSWDLLQIRKLIKNGAHWGSPEGSTHPNIVISSRNRNHFTSFRTAFRVSTNGFFVGCSTLRSAWKVLRGAASKMHNAEVCHWLQYTAMHRYIILQLR